MHRLNFQKLKNKKPNDYQTRLVEIKANILFVTITIFMFYNYINFLPHFKPWIKLKSKL